MPPKDRLGTATALPMRRLAAVWPWLPAFRAVAETENLRRAARFMGLSPPAISRTLRLLEEAVGHPLFERAGRKLVLNDAGQALLVATRRAMRTVDDALVGPPHALEVHAPPALAPLVAAALVAVAPPPDGDAAGEPQLAVRAEVRDTADVVAALLRGALDVALLPEALLGCPPDAVVVTPVGSVRCAVVCGAREAEAPARAVGLGGWDPWPPERGRAVLLEASELGTALAAAQQGLCLALPEALAPPSLARVGASWSVPVLALTRETVPGAERQERVQRAVEALRASLAPS